MTPTKYEYGRAAALSPRALRLFAAAVILAAVALVYGRTIGFGFVWDDEYFVVRNEAIRSAHELPRYFTDVSTSAAAGHDIPLWRPLRSISYMIDYQLAGLAPAWSHAHNVLLHGFNSVLLFLLLLQLGSWARPEGTEPAAREAGAGFSALVWALHPLQTESVAWVKSRDELLFTFFYFAALWFAAIGLSRARFPAGLFLAMLGSLALSLLSKEMAVTFPLAITALWMLTHPRPPLRTAALPIAATGALTALYLTARHLAIGATAQMPERLGGSAWADLLTTFAAIARYAELTLLPVRQLADYALFPIAESPLDGRVLLGIGVVGAALAAGVRFRRRDARITFGAAFVFITLLPVLNIVPAMQHLAERFLYLPLAGVAMCLATAAERALAAGPRTDRPLAHSRTNIVAALLAAIVVGYGTAAAVRASVWRSNDTLYTHIYEDGYRPRRAVNNYALVLVRQKRYEEAQPLLERLLEAAPDKHGMSRDQILNALAVCHLAQGRVEEGGRYAQEALAANADNASIHETMGLYHGLSGRHADAAHHYGRASELNPHNAQARQNYDTARRRAAADGATTTPAAAPADSPPAEP